MKVLVLSFYYHPDLSAGSFRTTAVVKALIEKLPKDASVDVLTTMPNRYSTFSVEVPAFEERPDCRVRIYRISLPRHKSGMLDQAKAFIHFARRVARQVRSHQYDIVYATSSRLMTAALGAWVSNCQKAKLYLDIRDIFVDTIKDVLPQRISVLTAPFFSFIERLTIRQADKVNLVSEGFKLYFQKRYPRLQYSYFTNGVDEEFARTAPPCVHPGGLGTNVLYAGNIGEGQGLHAIVPALASRMRGRVFFKIIGDGGCKIKLEIALKKNGIDNVEIFPPMKRNKLIQAYQQADVLFLHLNDHNAFKKVLPSKIFEYAAVGKPIWAGVSGYAADFLKTEVSNIAVFHPCNALEAEKAFGKLSFGNTPRPEFVNKFSRVKIMRDMAEDLLSLVC